MGDLIERQAAVAECQRALDEAKAAGVLQMAMGALNCRDNTGTLPAARYGWALDLTTGAVSFRRGKTAAIFGTEEGLRRWARATITPEGN